MRTFESALTCTDARKGKLINPTKMYMGQINSTVVTIRHPLGLHLRKSRDVVQTANQFEASITAQNLSRDSQAVDVKSILQLMQLQARTGHQLRLSADGPDAEEALNALTVLFESSSQSIS